MLINQRLNRVSQPELGLSRTLENAGVENDDEDCDFNSDIDEEGTVPDQHLQISANENSSDYSE